ncbi:MAG: site-2 protease family protein [Gemmatimonadales bacterium]
MKWAVKLGTVRGITLYMHLTFLILLAWVGLAHWQAERSVDAVVVGIGFTLALFACVVLHEFGHALTAQRYGIRTRDITLLPIGGVARLERMPDEPRQELIVAIAGPLVNVAIAAILFAGLALSNARIDLAQFSVGRGSFLGRLLVVNVVLVLFNLLPAFPMDGGRILRSILAMRMDYLRATQVAAQLGQGFALLFGVIGLFFNPFLIFIALFVWIGAAQEAAMTQMKTALSGIPLERAMITDFHTLSPEDNLGRAVELLLAGSQQDFPVVDGDQVEGVLCRSDLLVALSKQGQQSPVAEVMRRNVPTAEASEMIEVAFQRLQGRDCPTIPVLRRGRLVGLVTMENVGEFVSVQAALGGTRPMRRLPA